jgi:hypothetical protein
MGSTMSGNPEISKSPDSGSDTPAHVIVSERSGRWAVALRRELGREIRVFETRSVVQAWEQLACSPASFVVIELTNGNIDRFLTRMLRREREFPAARVAVAADRATAGCEWPAREAGAVLFVTSPRRVAVLADVARRHLATQPAPAVDVMERVWAELPWREHAAR